MKVLVTGATGFLGSHTVRALRRDGHDVRVMVRTPEKAESLFERMAIDGCEVVTGDITDRASVESAIAGCEAVVHTAADDEISATVHRVISGRDRPPRYSAPILLRGRSGIIFDAKRYLGGSLGNPLLQQCDGMTMDEIHTATQPSSFNRE